MKNGWKFLIGSSLALAISVLTACGGGGGGGNNNSDSYGVGGIAGASNATGYVGVGTWEGRLTVNNISAYRQFLYENGLCQGDQCYSASGYLQLQVSTQYGGGALPGPVAYRVTPFIRGFPLQTQSQNADGYLAGGQNGMALALNNSNANGGDCDLSTGCNQNAAPSQINTQFLNATHNSMNAQIISHGVVIATGALTGRVNYSPGAGSGAYGAQFYQQQQPYNQQPYYRTTPQVQYYRPQYYR